jgi:hypothetical protein
MGADRKITVEVPAELLKEARKASGRGITQTVCAGLERMAASRTYARLLSLRGKVPFSRSIADLKVDRSAVCTQASTSSRGTATSMHLQR